MGEAIVILAPTGTGGKKVGGGVARTPFNLTGLIEKFEMLEYLGSDNRKEGFIACHHGSTTSNQMADHASKEGVLGEQFDNLAIKRFWQIEISAC